MCVSGVGTRYVGITKGFKFVKFQNSKPFAIPIYEVPSLLTHMVASMEMIGAP